MSSSISLEGIPSDHLESIWPLVEGWLQRVVERDVYWSSTKDIFDFCDGRSGQLWIAWDHAQSKPLGVVVTEISQTPNGLMAFLTIVAGEDFNRWVGQVQTIEKWAVEQGCKVIQTYARRGLAKKIPDGWKPKKIIFEKVL